MHQEMAAQLRGAIIWSRLIVAEQFALVTRARSFHGLHILLAGLFMIPVLKAAAAFEIRGGLIAAASVGALYLRRILWSWRTSPLSNADQNAMIGVYLIVGVGAGGLVPVANIREWQHDEVIRRPFEAEHQKASAR